MKSSILLATILAAAVSTAHAGSWGFSLGNGAGFYFNKSNTACTPVYSAPVVHAPVYYQRPVVVYAQPQTTYMQPYQQMRPTYQPPTIIYRPEPMVIRHNHCHRR